MFRTVLRRSLPFLAIAVLAVGCTPGSAYHRPAAAVPGAYKEAPPAGWKEAQPSDGIIRGKWWEIFNDPDLNALEEQVAISNQNVLAAEAQFREAKDLVRIARSGLYPTITTSPSASTGQTGSGAAAGAGSGTRNSFSLPVDFSYQVDVWGSIRRTVRQNAELAQATFAQLENARLSYQAELASDYFQLHGVDDSAELLQRSVKLYQDYLHLTRDRYSSGVASGGDIAQAETQLHSTEASLIDLEQSRTQLEHAIAVLIGKPPSELSLPAGSLKLPPPIPIGLPSTLLERRPDIADSERRMAAANESIGIASAAFYPALLITASGGFQSGSFIDWFTWPSRFWSVGASLAETLFDAGKRRAQVAEAQDTYDVTVATYRQTALSAFQQVEDNLAALRVLENEATAVDAEVQSAEQSLDISTAQYKAGTVGYLQVITSQTAALQSHRSAVDVLSRRMNASVLLIEALGGGWNNSALPGEKSLIP